MFKRFMAALVALSLCLPLGVVPASADNQMNYKVLPASEASSLPKAGGTLGLNVGPAASINSGGLSFRLLRVNTVKPGSPGAAAGFRAGDDIIAVDGRVFPSVPAFAGYVGSIAPGKQISIDFIPAGGGPQQAQRATATLAGTGTGTAATAPQATPAPADEQKSGTLSTGAKVAIGAAAVALFGCYRLGCFNRFKRTPATAR